MRLVKINAVLFAKMMKMLTAEDGATWTQIANATGLHRNTVGNYVREMYKQRVVYVCGWERDGRASYSIRVFKLGSERDVKRPVQTRAEIARRYKTKRKLKEQNAFLYGRAA